MNVLAIESSAVTASAAVSRDGVIVGEKFINNGLTHSETLAPLAAQSLEAAGMVLFDMDAVAVTTGPGSFTGVRIGVALAKGLAMPNEIPCFGVSSIEAAAYPFRNSPGIVMAAMDARRQQVYTAFFTAGDDAPKRLTEDAAIGLAEAEAFLREKAQPVTLCGDGARVAYDYFTKSGLANDLSVTLPEGDCVYQRASSVALLTDYYLMKTEKTPVDAIFLRPKYLRLSQAERELKNRK
ncbi:MAG: tRNA (adenosine(37)-N6)-threonylcarbamoyltransferase complex dimerization subunit type 1 TsaB [Clostridia bacterium]|nr:tRNA (adenosine(37)-N6)-threonylcarbamoyltransferase complex dimerization subunit type 1 TsaB [Clostridia bacterium]